MSFNEFVTVLGTLKLTAPREDKLGLVFRMYDRSTPRGELDPKEVKLLLETGLGAAGSVPGGDGEGDSPVENIMKRIELKSSSRPQTAPAALAYRPGGGGGVRLTEAEFQDALTDQTLTGLVPGGSGGISEDQLLEATVKKSSRLCVIL